MIPIGEFRFHILQRCPEYSSEGDLNHGIDLKGLIPDSVPGIVDQVALLTRFERKSAAPNKGSFSLRGQRWMWVARVLKRQVDKSNTPPFSRAELKKPASDSIFLTRAYHLLLVASIARLGPGAG